MNRKNVCIDCGSPVEILHHASGYYIDNGRAYVCQCADRTCRASFAGYGVTENDAHNDHVKRCERMGYTRWLSEKLAELCERRAEA